MKQLHGLRVPSAVFGDVAPLSLQVIEDGEDRIIIDGSSAALLTAEEARLLADLLNEAANRVDPKREKIPNAAMELARSMAGELARSVAGIPSYQEASNSDNEAAEDWDVTESEVQTFVEAAPLKPFAFRKPKTPSMWTPERNEVLKREVPRGRLTREQLYAELSALPGPAIPNAGRLGTQASQLGLKWPEKAPQTPQEPPAEAAATEAAPEPEEPPEPAPAPAYDEPKPRFADAAMLARLSRRPDPDEEQAAGRNEVLEFAAKCGLPFANWETDLERINKKRADLGLPKFVQRTLYERKRANAAD